ncbi:MAG: hypothetical protein J3R72DRAFT_494804 [Linnemannia gamsii]|nr:MAG: hypothetical protein J3R72DRAFT_494804 [Linnemannia gamsii]
MAGYVLAKSLYSSSASYCGNIKKRFNPTGTGAGTGTVSETTSSSDSSSPHIDPDAPPTIDITGWQDDKLLRTDFIIMSSNAHRRPTLAFLRPTMLQAVPFFRNTILSNCL